MSTFASPDVLHFSTQTLPARDRLSIWSEVFGRHVAKCQYQRMPGAEFFHTAVLRRLPGISLMSSTASGFRAERTRALLTDNCDDLIFAVNGEGTAYVSQRGSEIEIRPHEAFLLDLADRATVTYPAAATFNVFSIPRNLIAPMLADFGAMLGRQLPKSETLRLLTGYIASLGQQELQASESRQAVATYLRDLVILALGGTREARSIAKARGLRATRLAAMKADIVARLFDESLSVGKISGRHQVTKRYVQMLFEEDGRTFSEYVLEQRLARAHRLLIDPRLTDRTISSIAFQVGFSNLSYFNRTFRLRYGMTPSDLRGAAG